MQALCTFTSQTVPGNPGFVLLLLGLTTCSFLLSKGSISTASLGVIRNFLKAALIQSIRIDFRLAFVKLCENHGTFPRIPVYCGIKTEHQQIYVLSHHFPCLGRLCHLYVLRRNELCGSFGLQTNSIFFTRFLSTWLDFLGYKARHQFIPTFRKHNRKTGCTAEQDNLRAGEAEFSSHRSTKPATTRRWFSLLCRSSRFSRTSATSTRFSR